MKTVGDDAVSRISMGRPMPTVLLILTGLVLFSAPPSAKARDIAIDPGNAYLYTANHDSRSVSKISLQTQVKLNEFSFELAPQNLIVDGQDRLWVTFLHDDRVGVFDGDDGSRLALIETGDEPFDVLQVSDTLIAVTLFRADILLLINAETFVIQNSVPTLPNPRGLAMKPDGSKLYVTHFFSGALSVIDIMTWGVDTSLQPESQGNLFQNLVITVDGAKAYLPNTRSNVTNQALVFDTTVFPVVSVVNLNTNTALPAERLSLDIADQPVGIPIDAALTADHLFVLNSGSNDISVISRTTWMGVAHIEVGDNPRSMVLSGDEALLFVHNQLSGSVSVVDTQTLEVINEIQSTSIPLPVDLLNGKRLFNSSDRTNMSRDQWISCASCHFDGEMDHRTWFFPDGPRNTTSLLGSEQTAPYHWSGDLDELHDVESTIRTIQAGTGLAEGGDNCSPTCDAGAPNAGRSQDLDDLAAFLASLRLPPNPNLESTGYFSDSAAQGARLFHSAATGCGTCHIAPSYTDHQRHDVGTGGAPDERKGPDFDTPSLRGVYATAPYLHDGRAATLREVLDTYNPGDLHGVTSGLSEQQIDNIVAFLESLTHEPPVFRNSFE